MSHFSVMVIGDNLGEQLHAYDENRDDILTDKTDEVHEAAVEKHKVRTIEGKYRLAYGDAAEINNVTEITLLEYYGNDLDKLAEEWFGFIKDENGRYISSYNPNSKWDWWCIGGRWRNMLLHVENPKYPGKIIHGELSTFEHLNLSNGIQPDQPARRCDAAALCDIDWEAMSKESIMESVARWEHFIDNNPELRPGMTAEELKEFREIGNKINDEMYLWGRDHVPTKQEVTDKAASVTTFALVKDGEWFEKGKMGWFGISTDDKSCTEWSTIFEQQIEGLPEDTTITIIDCHI